MAMRLNLETRRRTWMTDLACKADPDQRVQHSIDRGSRYPRKPKRDIFGNLICCRVIMTLHQGFQDGTPLYGQRKTILTAQPLQLFHLGGNGNSVSHNVATILQELFIVNSEYISSLDFVRQALRLQWCSGVWEVLKSWLRDVRRRLATTNSGTATLIRTLK